jgi:hypothetical protein
MKTFKDGRYLRKINKYGGLEKEMGHLYIDIVDNHFIIVRSAINSTKHLYEFEDEIIHMEFDIENNIPKEYYDQIIWNIKDSFGSQFAYNFSNYDIVIKNISEFFNRIKEKIKTSSQINKN